MVGLVLAALAVGYFLLTGRFTSNKTTTQTEVPEITVTPQPTLTPIIPVQKTQDTQVTPPAMAAARNRITTLPKTGYPQVLLGIITIGIMVSGLGLRKFPH